MKRIKVYGSFRSGKSRKLINYMIDYLNKGKKCLFISLGDYSEYDLFKIIKSSLPVSLPECTGLKDISDKLEYIIGNAYMDVDKIIDTLKNRIDYDAIFIDPVNGFNDYDKKKVEIYSKLRDLSDLLGADLYVSLCTGPGSEFGITDF